MDGDDFPMFAVRGLTRERFWVDPGDGQPLNGKYYRSLDIAETRAHHAENKAARAARLRPRACLCCSSTFDSEGPHNRLCDTCRGHAGSASDGRC